MIHPSVTKRRVISINSERCLNGEGLYQAAKFLVDNLTEGERLSAEVLGKAKESGINDRTLQRAKSVLGVKSRRVDNRWLMSAPEDIAERFAGCVRLSKASFSTGNPAGSSKNGTASSDWV